MQSSSNNSHIDLASQGDRQEPRREDPSAMPVLAGIIGRSFVSPALMKRASQEPSLALDTRFKKMGGAGACPLQPLHSRMLTSRETATNKILQIKESIIIAGVVEGGKKCGTMSSQAALAIGPELIF